MPENEAESRDETPGLRPAERGELAEPSSDLVVPTVNDSAENNKVTKLKPLVIDADEKA